MCVLSGWHNVSSKPSDGSQVFRLAAQFLLGHQQIKAGPVQWLQAGGEDGQSTHSRRTQRDDWAQRKLHILTCSCSAPWAAFVFRITASIIHHAVLQCELKCNITTNDCTCSNGTFAAWNGLNQLECETFKKGHWHAIEGKITLWFVVLAYLLLSEHK